MRALSLSLLSLSLSLSLCMCSWLSVSVFWEEKGEGFQQDAEAEAFDACDCIICSPLDVTALPTGVYKSVSAEGQDLCHK